jgi:hypothetical protein
MSTFGQDFVQWVGRTLTGDDESSEGGGQQSKNQLPDPPYKDALPAEEEDDYFMNQPLP